MRTSAKIVVILLCTFIVAALAQEVARIDLTAQRAAEPTMPLRWHSSRHAMVIDGRHDTPPPLTTAIVAVAPTRVELQESIGFEVTITNNSPEPFALPSSPTLTDIEPPDHATPYKYMQTQIQLVFGKGDNKSTVGTPAFMFAAGSRESSFTVLHQGQSVRVRANTRVYLHKDLLGEDKESTKELKAFSVVQISEVSVEKQDGQWGDVESPRTVPIASSNSIPIEIVSAKNKQKKDERH